MRNEVVNTEIKCDVCQQLILGPRSDYQALKYFQFEEVDLCPSCSMGILYKIVQTKKINREELDELIDDMKSYTIVVPPGVILC